MIKLVVVKKNTLPTDWVNLRTSVFDGASTHGDIAIVDTIVNITS